jgi:hypothetical protein
VWSYSWRDKKSKWDKPPRSARGGGFVDGTSPASWATFADALASYRAHEHDGVGIAMAEDDAEDARVAIDLDKCRDPITGAIAEWAARVVEGVWTYTEVSPSGAGLRLFCRGAMKATGRKRGPLEVYRKGHYLTVTGQHLPGTPRQVMGRRDELAALLAEHFPERPEPPPQPREAPKAGGLVIRAPSAKLLMLAAHPSEWTDDQLVGRATRARNGDKFARLWSGDASDYKSASEADAALIARLWFWTGGDRARVDRLYRQSGLCRGKYEDREDYRKDTLDFACKGQVYTPREEQPSEEARDNPSLTNHVNVVIEEKDCPAPPFLSLAPPPPAEACPGGVAASKLTLWNRHDRSQAKVITAACKRWTCVVCGHRMAYAKAHHYAARFSGCGPPLFASDHDEGEWKSLRKIVARQKADFLRVCPGDGRITVFAPVPLPGSVELTVEAAVARLDECVLSLPRRTTAAPGKAVFTSSRGWKPPKPPKHVAEWRRVNEINTKDPEPVVEVLKRRGIEASVSRRCEFWQVKWTFPTRMMEIDIARVFNDLRAIGEDAECP